MAKRDSRGWLVVVDPNRRYIFPGERDRIRFTYMHDGWNESKSAQYSSTAVLGRSEPVRGYMGSGPRVLQIQLTVPPEADDFPTRPYTTRVVPLAQRVRAFNQVDRTSGEGQSIGTDANGNPIFSTTVTANSLDNYFTQKWEVLDFLRALVYPQYNDDTQMVIYPPPRVLVLLGTWFSLLGIVTSWSFTHKGPNDAGDPQYMTTGRWRQATGYGPEKGTMTPYYTEVSLTIEEADEPYSYREVLNGKLRTSGTDKKIASLSSTFNGR